MSLWPWFCFSVTEVWEGTETTEFSDARRRKRLQRRGKPKVKLKSISVFSYTLAKKLGNATLGGCNGRRRRENSITPRPKLFLLSFHWFEYPLPPPPSHHSQLSEHRTYLYLCISSLCVKQVELAYTG
jgi:hypothetical protein